MANKNIVDVQKAAGQIKQKLLKYSLSDDISIKTKHNKEDYSYILMTIRGSNLDKKQILSIVEDTFNEFHIPIDNSSIKYKVWPYAIELILQTSFVKVSEKDGFREAVYDALGIVDFSGYGLDATNTFEHNGQTLEIKETSLQNIIGRVFNTTKNVDDAVSKIVAKATPSELYTESIKKDNIMANKKRLNEETNYQRYKDATTEWQHVKHNNSFLKEFREKVGHSPFENLDYLFAYLELLPEVRDFITTAGVRTFGYAVDAESLYQEYKDKYPTLQFKYKKGKDWATPSTLKVKGRLEDIVKLAMDIGEVNTTLYSKRLSINLEHLQDKLFQSGIAHSYRNPNYVADHIYDNYKDFIAEHSLNKYQGYSPLKLYDDLGKQFKDGTLSDEDKEAYELLKSFWEGSVNESLGKSNKLTLNEDLFESFGRPDSWNDEPDNNFIVDLGDREDVCVSFEDAVESANKNNTDVITEQPPYSTKIIRKWIRGADGRFKVSTDESLSSESLREEIFDFLEELGGYTDYTGRIEAVAEEFNISFDEAEGFVDEWIHTADDEYEFDESLKEDLYLVSQEPSDETPATSEANGIAKLILDAINDESDTIKMYNDLIANTDNEDIINIIQDITAEENNHLGMLQKALEIVSPNASNIEDGVEEAQGMIADAVVNVDPEFIPVEESLSESLNESFWFGKYIDVNGKTHKVYFKFEGNFEEAEEEFNEIIPEPYTKSVLSGQADEYGLKRDGFTLINEHLTEDLHDKFKRDIKNNYKSWVAKQEKVEKARKEMLDMLDDTVSEETREKWTKLAMDRYPDVKFEYSFPKNIEKDDYPFYVTYYAEYPIYEPAEGGYYYPGRDAVWSEGFNSEEEAREFAKKYVTEDGDNWQEKSNGYELKGKYIGQDQSVNIEPQKAYLSAIAEWHPYE